MTKIIHFLAKSKCINTSSNVKMQRFAADGVGRVLYYEASFGRKRPTVSSVAARPGFNGNFVPKAKGVTWKYRTLLCKVWVRSLFSLKRWGCVKYRINTDLFLSTQPMSTNSLLTPCSKVRYFHVAPWPWQCERTPYSHQARCGTFLSSTMCNEKSTWVVTISGNV